MSQKDKKEPAQPNTPDTPNPAGNSINISGQGNIIGGIAQGSQSSVEAHVVANQYGQSSTTAQQQKLFDDLQKQVAALSDEFQKQMAQVAVNGLKDELAKGDQADEDTLKIRLEAIRKTLGDVVEVVIATIASPQAGFSLIAQKVAARAVEQSRGKS